MVEWTAIVFCESMYQKVNETFDLLLCKGCSTLFLMQLKKPRLHRVVGELMKWER